MIFLIFIGMLLEGLLEMLQYHWGWVVYGGILLALGQYL